LKERGLDLKMEGPVSMPVHGDRTKIQGNLQNLMLNALKYTRTGGVSANWGSSESHDAYAGSTFRVLLPRQFNE
jgi:two-component system, chemotaxis family, CheB/CheR fusion protein